MTTVVLVAIDASPQAEGAFDCKYKKAKYYAFSVVFHVGMIFLTNNGIQRRVVIKTTSHGKPYKVHFLFKVCQSC